MIRAFIVYLAGIGAILCATPWVSTSSAQELSSDAIPQSWTASAAVEFALKANPDSAISRKRIEQAQATASLARSADYPLVNLSAEYAQTDNPMYSFGNILNQGSFNNSIDFNDPGRTDDLQLKAEVSYRLYNGGSSQAAIAGADASVKASQADQDSLHRRLAFEVVRTYQAILQAKEMVGVREEALEAIRAAHQVGQARYDAGDMLRQDLLNLELQESRATENLIRSRHNLELTKRSFLNLLGLTGDDVVLQPDVSENPELPAQIDFHNRLELIKLNELERAAQAEVQKIQGTNRPNVDAFASYQVDQGFVLEDSGDSWMAGVRLNYNLFDGHAVSSKITRARLKLQQVREQRHKLELALNLEMQKAKLNYEQARQRLAVTEKMVGVAIEVARLSRERFREGVILSSDLIDYEMRLSDARARNLAAEAGFQVAIADLRRVSGLEQFPKQ